MDTIELRLLDKKYSKELLNLWGNENVMKYTYLDTLSSVEQVEVRIDFWIKQHTSKSFSNNFVVVLNEKVIGVSGFPLIKKEPFLCGMYYQIMEEYQGRGIGTKVVSMMLEMIKEHYKEGRIITRCTSKNEASKKVLIKNGFECIELEKDGFERNGIFDDVEKYVLKFYKPLY